MIFFKQKSEILIKSFFELKLLKIFYEYYLNALFFIQKLKIAYTKNFCNSKNLEQMEKNKEEKKRRTWRKN